MKFYLYLLLGFIGGIPAGMGMGGGTLTIPLLTLIGKVGQKVAQSANLFAFLPMSGFALKKHFENGLIEKKGTLSVIIPALLFSMLFSFLAYDLPSELLKKLFGIFLILLSFFTLKNNLKKGA